jgi:hypothetical protein
VSDDPINGVLDLREKVDHLASQHLGRALRCVVRAFL